MELSHHLHGNRVITRSVDGRCAQSLTDGRTDGTKITPHPALQFNYSVIAMATTLQKYTIVRVVMKCFRAVYAPLGS